MGAVCFFGGLFVDFRWPGNSCKRKGVLEEEGGGGVGVFCPIPSGLSMEYFI